MIDLSSLPAPNVVQEIDYETLLSERKERYIATYPESEQAAIRARLALESDPTTKLIQEAAYYRMLHIQSINEAAKACMLAYAQQSDLDQLAANLGVERLLVTPGDPSAVPPVAPVYESDDRLRYRAQMALEGLSVAGPKGSYIFHALTASARVEDVSITRPERGRVRVTILAADNGGVADELLLKIVDDYLNEDIRRPVSDDVVVVPAELIDFSINATLYFYPGPSSDAVLSAAQAALEKYLTSIKKLGYDPTRSGIFAALHQPGVRSVVLDSPAEDIALSPLQAGRCTSILLEIGGRDV